MQNADLNEPGNADGSEPDGHLNAPGNRGKNAKSPAPASAEVGGRDGPEPTRYGDWEKNGRCIDF